MASLTCALCPLPASDKCTAAGGRLCRHHDCQCGNHPDRASGSMRGESSDAPRQASYHSSIPMRVLHALRKWCGCTSRRVQVSAEEDHCQLCVAWMAALPNIDCANGDPNLDSGPFAGLPRSVFQNLSLKFGRHRGVLCCTSLGMERSFAGSSAKWSQGLGA